ncbi:hypothetical protein [Cellulosimicrobium cellulans]|uniref:hypothetical protein n=1 Tax=Cellulosimicrobium cellulans TaxID=1710 RepID=UPI00130EF470|nr:hypothetical protein [Cellulosimicrobium cellulans]
MRWSWSAALVIVGLLLKIVLSPIDETLGNWVGGSVAFGGVVVLPLIHWLRSRERAHETASSGVDRQEDPKRSGDDELH